jgi:hypothetical protein
MNVKCCQAVQGLWEKEEESTKSEHKDRETKHKNIGRMLHTKIICIRTTLFKNFQCNNVGIVSVELNIYNSGLKNAEVFSAKRDLSSLIWHMKDGKAYIIEQLHSGENKVGSTSNHITYCTFGWYLLAQIKKH